MYIRLSKIIYMQEIVPMHLYEYLKKLCINQLCAKSHKLWQKIDEILAG